VFNLKIENLIFQKGSAFQKAEPFFREIKIKKGQKHASYG